MSLSSDRAYSPAGRLSTVRPDGTPVYRYRDTLSGMPPVSVFVADARVGGTPVPHDRHAHDFFVLVYMERGAGVMTFDGRDVRMRTGEVHAVPPGMVVATSPSDPGEPCRVWSVAFMPDAVPALAAVSPLSWTLHPYLSMFAAEGPVEVPEGQRSRWVARLCELYDEVRHPARPGAAEAASAVLTLVLIAGSRLVEAPVDGPDPLVQRVFDRIEARFAEPVNAGDIARDLGYTPGHLTTVTRDRTGRTLLELLTERRMTEVRRLLRDTTLPLKVIASRTGLRDASYLVRRFKARYGVTPNRYRRQSGLTPPPEGGSPRNS